MNINSPTDLVNSLGVPSSCKVFITTPIERYNFLSLVASATAAVETVLVPDGAGAARASERAV